MVNGAPAYKDPAWLKEQYITKNLDQRTIGAIAGVSHHTIRTWIRKHGLQKPPGSWTIGVEPWNKGKRYQAGWQYIEIFGRSPDEAGEAQRPRGGGHLLIPRPRRIKRIAYAGVQMTYDIHMEDPHHNFVANGIVTHNSQLSQRFVDESDTDFVEPDIIASDPELHAIWLESICKSHEAYCRLAEGLADKIERDYPHLKGRHKRKRAREAARSVLPNATETKIFMTANARALRHFVEYRGAPDAEPEIRKVAMQVLEIMQREAPNLFGDYQVEALPDGSTSAKTEHKKV
jgi:hypothetical protein